MTQGQKATEVQLYLKTHPRIEKNEPDSSDFILFTAVQHMSIPQFFVGCFHNCLFQTAVVAYSGNMDVSQRVVFHHHFEISG